MPDNMQWARCSVQRSSVPSLEYTTATVFPWLKKVLASHGHHLGMLALTIRYEESIGLFADSHIADLAATVISWC